MRQLSGKFHIENDQIVKTSNGESIPEDEPVFLLRARDRLALQRLYDYRRACAYDGCTEYQRDGIEERVNAFEKFRRDHPERMKQPGITKGK